MDILKGGRDIELQEAEDLSQIGAHAFDNRAMGTKVVMTNQTFEDSERIEVLIPRALRIAESTKPRLKFIFSNLLRG